MLLLMKIAQQRVSLSRVVIKSVHLFDMYLRLKTTYINIEEFQDWGQTKEKNKYVNEMVVAFFFRLFSTKIIKLF